MRRVTWVVLIGVFAATACSSVDRNAGSVPFQEVADSHAASGFGILWRGDHGLWFAPDGTGMWVARGQSGLYARQMRSFYVTEDGACMRRARPSRSGREIVSCVSMTEGRCRLRHNIGGVGARVTAACRTILSKPASWDGL